LAECDELLQRAGLALLAALFAALAHFFAFELSQLPC
jgi:hypothetical protein